MKIKMKEMCTLHVVIFWQDNIEWYNNCNKENINRHNFSTIAHTIPFTQNAVFGTL